MMSGLAGTCREYSVGVGVQKKRSWALPGIQSLFAFVTLFVSLEFLFRGFGATGSDPASFVNVPASTFSWIIWAVFNVQGVASTITPLILSVLLAAWVPSYVSLREQRVRAHFGLPTLAVTGKPLLVCISLCWLLPLYGFAIPAALYDPNDLSDAAGILECTLKHFRSSHSSLPALFLRRGAVLATIILPTEPF